MSNLYEPSLTRATDDNGDPVSGAKLYFYQTGTTTPASVYADMGCTVATSHPVVADSTGLFDPVYLPFDQTFRVRLTNADGSDVYYDVDGVSTELVQGVSLDGDRLALAEAERIRFSIQLRRYNEDANTSFARMANCCATSSVVGFVAWCARNDFFTDAEQAIRLSAADLTVNKAARTAVLGSTRVLAADADWDTGDPAASGTGRGKEFHPVLHRIKAGHASHVGEVLLLWNHLDSADGRDDLGTPYTIPIHYALSDNAQPFTTAPTPIVAVSSAAAYTHTGNSTPTVDRGPSLAPGNNIIQLPSTSQWAGRLVAVCGLLGDTKWTPLLFYTDDIDDGWTLGGFNVPASNLTENESSLAYDSVNDEIVVLTRLDANDGSTLTTTGRGVYRSTDGGATLTEVGVSTDLFLGNAATAMLQTVTDGSGRSRMLIGGSATSDYYGGTDYAIYICYGGDLAPSAVYRPFPADFAIRYAQLIMPDDDTIWLIHEDFSGIGQINTKNNLGITVLSMAEIILGAEAI